jgi:phosphoglycolate phosphatase
MTKRVLLFDIDGTLVTAAPGRGYRREIQRVLETVFGTAGALDRVDFGGKTDLLILREALEPAGVDVGLIRERLVEWQELFVELSERLGRDAPLFVPCGGTRELLARLDGDERYALSVLTGNLEPMATVKLSAVGYEGFFRLRGAYGSDHEDRNALPAIASERIRAQTGRDYAPADFVIVGDTPRDIHAARAFGMRVVAVATGHFSLDALAAHGPDALLPDLCDPEAFYAAIG